MEDDAPDSYHPDSSAGDRPSLAFVLGLFGAGAVVGGLIVYLILRI